jgi:hypothetical protein
MAAVGALAATRLLDMIDGRPVPEIATFLPTSLVVRRSCGCADDGMPSEASIDPQQVSTSHQEREPA